MGDAFGERENKLLWAVWILGKWLVEEREGGGWMLMEGSFLCGEIEEKVKMGGN